MELAPRADDHLHGRLRRRYQPAGRLDDPPHRRVLPADDLDVRDHRPEPVEEVENLRARATREQVLAAAGEAHHLVREDGAEDQDVVDLEEATVRADADLLPEKPVCDLGDLALADAAGLAEGLVRVPLVHVDRDGLTSREAESRADLALDLRRVRAERDHHLDRLRATPECFEHQGKDQADRTRARVVGHDGKHAFAVHRHRGDALGNDGAYLVGGERPVLVSSSCGHTGIISQPSSSSSALEAASAMG